MDRRDFLQSSLALDNATVETVKTRNKSGSNHKVLAPAILKKNTPRVLSGIEPYTGTWNARTAGHLLRRALFGATSAQINQFAATTLDASINKLFQTQAPPPPPVEPSNGISWTDKAYDGTNNGLYVKNLKYWWMGIILTQNQTILEKLTLFWHNHFVSESSMVIDARYMYKQNALLREYALGNIKDFVKAITLDPAMLRYLNGNTNVNGKPNENYARELQELFTIGNGPEITPGNYTNYTEADVQAAARVLTGWKDNANTLMTSFTLSSHDKTDKQFSPDYQNTVIKGRNTTSAGDDELNGLVEMIFNQQETAKYFCRKFYRWFVYYEIDDTTEQNVIEPLADMLRTSNYDVLGVLKTLLKSSHFYDESNIGCQIKNPIDFIAGVAGHFNLTLPDISSDSVNYYRLLGILENYGALLEMNLFDPPNVAGWPAYYQVPDFYQIWLNTATLPSRNGFTDTLLYSTKYKPFNIDSVAFVTQVSSDPSNAQKLISELSDLLFVNSLTSQQQDYIMTNVFLPGLPDYEWTAEWNDYTANPTNNTKKQTVAAKLNAMLRFMLRMAEYQLA